MIKAVILDLDDTLIMTEAACFSLENAVLQRMGRRPMSREIHLKTWGQPLFEATLLRSPGVDIAEYRRVLAPLLDEYVANGKLDAVTTAALETIDTIKTSLKKAVLVLTSREESELKHFLSPTNPLARKLDGFYHRDNMLFHKPDPRAFAHIEAEHGWKPDECLYVGDSTGDAAAAKGAGLHFIASLESGLRAKEDFSEYPVDAFVDALPDLVGAIQGLEQNLTTFR